MDMGRDFVKLRVGKVNGFLKEVFKRKSIDKILTYWKSTPSVFTLLRAISLFLRVTSLFIWGLWRSVEWLLRVSDNRLAKLGYILVDTNPTYKVVNICDSIEATVYLQQHQQEVDLASTPALVKAVWH